MASNGRNKKNRRQDSTGAGGAKPEGQTVEASESGPQVDDVPTEPVAAPRSSEEEDLELKTSELAAREGAVAKALEEAKRAMAAVEAAKADLVERELAVAKAEAEMEAGFAERKRELEEGLIAKRGKLEDEIADKRRSALEKLDSEISTEREKRLKLLDSELAEQRKAFGEEEARLGDLRVALAARETELEQHQKTLEAKEAALEQARAEIASEVERRVEQKSRSLDAIKMGVDEQRDALEEEVAQRVSERKRSFEQRESSLSQEIDRLRGQLDSAERMVGIFDDLKRRLGNRDPEEVLAELAAKENALRDLRERGSEASVAVQAEYDRLTAERDQAQKALDERTEELSTARGRLRGEDALRRELEEEKRQGKSLKTQLDVLEGQCETLSDENRRLRATYERVADREARIGDIEALDQKDDRDIPRLARGLDIDEIEWLDGIAASCEEYGFRFNKRILYAFHTALKTAEWSPLTVLAGVSGTGKSELPRLYSHFGGLVFSSLSVQPNWDSQEAMLGFFNSIDNKFDAQPILRLLARSQRPWDDRRGLEEHLVMVLLDEMNLAHAELYFAEFLSKLELRRGTKGDVPELDVKLGAGLIPYRLPLGRNVLWTGTMNQDETTKSLSDKVLDRSIVINFPRPAKLERRRELKPLKDAAPLLHRKVWESWWMKKSDFSEEDVSPYKSVVEEINRALGSVGRALGHRVWQSIEYYMANYPDTLAAHRENSAPRLQRAMRTAFEDQLVQKIMPKLRGIDTRGRSKADCLDKIRALIVENDYAIIDDFDLSCECGYGQFIWQSASFLQANSRAEVVDRDRAGDGGQGSAGVPDSGTSAPEGVDHVSTVGEPPENFYRDDPDRVMKWERLSDKKRQKYLEDNREEQDLRDSKWSEYIEDGE
jgi:hypothetical protein